MKNRIDDNQSKIFIQLDQSKEMVEVVTTSEARDMGLTRGKLIDYIKRGLIRTIKRYGTVYIDLQTITKIMNNPPNYERR